MTCCAPRALLEAEAVCASEDKQWIMRPETADIPSTPPYSSRVDITHWTRFATLGFILIQ